MKLAQSADMEMLKFGMQQHAASTASADKKETANGEKAKAASQPDMAAIMSNLSAALSAPKRIVRDADGRAIGVETGPSA